MLKEFRDFALRGNVLDLAVAVIIGGAFGKIVASLVGDIIMPLIGLLIGGVSFVDLSITVGSAVIAYGKFIQNIIDFIVIAFVIFMVVKSANSMKKPAPAPVKAAATTKTCPQCATEIPVKAKRCPNCTSQL
jgi:large conductance mechanosensitive channel